MTHEYFVDKAREIISRAGGNPDTAGHLAAWAEAAKTAGDVDRHGVIVAIDGTIVAETRNTHGAWRITDRAALDMDVDELGLVSADLQRRGTPTIHVRGWEVCTGQAEHKRRGRPRTTDTRITVGMTADLIADLDAEATARDVDRSEVIRQRLARLRWDPERTAVVIRSVRLASASRWL